MYQLQHYLDMMRDPHRMTPLDAAIRSTVRVGDVVLDLGAGTGVLTFIALDAGAAHVFAVERSPALDVARRVARANGLADRITFIQGDARSITPPRQVDGLIGDVRGTLPLLEDNIELFQAVRDRWLKPGGYTIPLSDEIYAAPVSSTRPYQRISGWRVPRPEAHYEAAAEMAANAFIRTNLEAADVLAPGQSLGTVRYDGATPRKLALETSFVIERSGEMTGVGAWFHGELTPQITFDTSPFVPPTIYAQAFFPLSKPRAVTAGEVLNVNLAVHRTPSEPTWTWRVSSKRGAGWRETHSTFKGALLGPAAIAWLEGSKCPSLSSDGIVARQVLAAIDDKTTAQDIAAQLSRACPERFASEEDALPHVMKLLGKYSAS
jgi:SAM-dependent methyltransferase